MSTSASHKLFAVTVLVVMFFVPYLLPAHARVGALSTSWTLKSAQVGLLQGSLGQIPHTTPLDLSNPQASRMVERAGDTYSFISAASLQ